MYKIGFTGTQKGMKGYQPFLIRLFFKKYASEISEVHHGDCIGADKDFHDIAKEFLLKVVLHPPKNPSKRAFCKAEVEFPKEEYLDRNHKIVDNCDMLIATPKGEEELRSGTWATIRYAKK